MTEATLVSGSPLVFLSMPRLSPIAGLALLVLGFLRHVSAAPIEADLFVGSSSASAHVDGSAGVRVVFEMSGERVTDHLARLTHIFSRSIRPLGLRLLLHFPRHRSSAYA